MPKILTTPHPFDLPFDELHLQNNWHEGLFPTLFITFVNSNNSKSSSEFGTIYKKDSLNTSKSISFPGILIGDLFEEGSYVTLFLLLISLSRSGIF